MKERPILFSAPMVRALLNGTKTQTRRVAKGIAGLHAVTREPLKYCDSAGPRVRCPYGQPGDRLWVKETWQAWTEFDGVGPDGISEDARARINYVADGNVWDARKRSSIHMPRWASRITLEITGVRVESLQDISESDVQAEGVKFAPDSAIDLVTGGSLAGYVIGKDGFSNAPGAYLLAYRALWESLHGPDSWDANPWVWVIEFKRVTAEHSHG